jgi:hypothetical protein
MVMGTDRAINKLNSMPEIDAILMYSDDEGQIRTYMTNGIKKQVTLE